MRLRCIVVVLCDIRRGLDGHVVFPRLIQSRRFRPVERLTLRVVDQVVVFRPAAGGADVLYLNLPDSRFQIVIGGNRNKLRSVLFPDRVDGLGRFVLGQRNQVAAMVLRSRSIRIVCPAKERVAVTGRYAFVDVELVAFRRCGCRDCPLGRTRSNVVEIMNQRVGILGGGRLLVDKVEILRAGIRLRTGNVRSRIYRAACPAIEGSLFFSLRIIRIELPACPVFCIVRIELFQFYRMVVARMSCAILTSNGDCLEQHRILVAKGSRTVQYNLVNPYRDFVPGAVGRHSRHRQHAEHHNQN